MIKQVRFFGGPKDGALIAVGGEQDSITFLSPAHPLSFEEVKPGSESPAISYLRHVYDIDGNVARYREPSPPAQGQGGGR